MSRPQKFLKTALESVKGHAVFSTIPWSLLLVGLEKLIEVELFSCPCIVELNGLLTVVIFVGPGLLTFTLMFIFLRPCKHEWSRCCSGIHDTKETWPKTLATCLILPAVWFMILLFHGEYIACAMTDWKGVYVFDKEFNRYWCKPNEKMINETKLRDLTIKHIHQSQCAGYFCMCFFCVTVIAALGINDCCGSGKCDRFCGRERAKKRDEQELTPSNATSIQMPFSSEAAQDV